MNMTGPKADLAYGATGTTKTTQIGELAEYVFELTGKRTRLVTADGGGYETIKPHVEAGMIDVWPVLNEAHAIEALDFACQGYWPVEKDGKRVLSKDGLDAIAGYAFEGLTSFGDLILKHLRSTGAKLSQEPNFVYKDGDSTYYGSNMTYYGFVQDRLYDLVLKSHMLPVERVLWTALEGKGEEEGTRIPIFGPAIAGKKSIGKAPQWFGNSIHLEMLVTEGKEDANKQIQVTAKPVMYLKPHADKISKLVFPAKTRAPKEFAAQLPEFYDPPSLKKLYETLDSFKAKGAERVRQMMAARKVA